MKYWQGPCHSGQGTTMTVELPKAAGLWVFMSYGNDGNRRGGLQGTPGKTESTSYKEMTTESFSRNPGFEVQSWEGEGGVTRKVTLQAKVSVEMTVVVES